jgi:aminoglycoside phosphotransferase (APT) family kinase protein
VDAEPVPGGLFGQNVFVRSTRGEFILRGAPHFDWQLAKERFVARLIHERTSLESPWPYWIEESAELFGWGFALMPRLGGVVEGASGRDDERAYAVALGEGLARLHELGWETPGYYDPELDSIRPYPVSHAERVVSQVQERLRKCRDASDATTERDVAWIEEVLAANRAALDEPFDPCYVHHDWKPNNVLAERTPECGRVTGVVDLMEGYFGDPEEDLVRSIGTLARGDRGRVRRFVAAYRTGRPLRPGFAERYKLYQLLDSLVLWEYGQRNRVWFPEGQPFRAFAGYFVDELRPF